MKLAAAALLLSSSSMGAARPVIVDTDAGTDDLMAIAFLLSRADVDIEAITVVSGVAHVHPGARNILRLLKLADRENIPVYEGPDATAPGGHAFPEMWRKPADELPGVDLPPTKRAAESQPAGVFLARRLHNPAQPLSVLALGPLTNIAAALDRDPRRGSIAEIVIMGGAVRVPGNVDDARSAEWNIFADPLAAKKVFESGAPIRLVPLDATNKVPIDLAYTLEFKRQAATPLGKVTARILERSRAAIESHMFFAWDPLAAVALVQPDVAKFSALALSVDAGGRIREVSGAKPNSQAALDADPALFHRLFLSAFKSPKR